MKVILEDEAEGETWSGYVSIEIVDDAGDVVIDANVAPDWMPDVGEFRELFDVVADVVEDDHADDFDPTIGPGGPGWPEEER